MADTGLRFPGDADGGQRVALQDALALQGVRRLDLGPALEAGYREHCIEVAATNVREHWALVIAAVSLIELTMLGSGLVDAALRPLVLTGMGTVIAVILAVALVAISPSLRVHIDRAVAVAGFLVLLGLQVGAAVAPDGSALRAIAEYGVIFVTLAACTVSGVPFRVSLGVCLAAAGTFLACAVFAAMQAGWLASLAVPTAVEPLTRGFAPDWQRYPFYGIGSIVIAGLIGLAREVRERTVFLQARLLQVEKQELDQLTRELTLISREDALTGLANRRHFDEVFTREWAACQREGVPVNLLFIDVDYFKRYNDHYGHQAGDICLAQVGRALRAQAMRGADFVARYGGEEFVAMFPRTNHEGLEAIARRLVESVDQLAIPHAASDVAPHVTISVGVASLVPAPQHGPEVLVQAADTALYRTKQSGRHGYRASWEEPA